MKRVVVTGIGLITPLGNDVQSFWNHILSGVCGIEYITRFDTENFKVKIAAEVKSFDRRIIWRKQMPEDQICFHSMAAAAVQAMSDSNC
jgi:3-oxoacyl-[acyl-carrier-protein] synthase II